MTRSRRLWVPLLVGLLVAALLGPTAGRAAPTLEPRIVIAALMIPAAAFGIGDGTVDNAGFAMKPDGPSAAGAIAALSFPVSEVNIRRITLYAYDNNAGGSVTVSLMRSDPKEDPVAPITQGWVGTSGASTMQPQVATTTDISPRRVNTAIHASFLEVSMAPGTHLYGVKINYSYESVP